VAAGGPRSLGGGPRRCWPGRSRRPPGPRAGGL